MFQGDLKRILCFDCNACRIEINEKKDESFFMFRENKKSGPKGPGFVLLKANGSRLKVQGTR